MTSLELIGVDGCKFGWVVVSSNERFSDLQFEVTPDLESVFARNEGGKVMIGIDMPIGLSENGRRACDVEARQRLGRPRSSSVFPPPCRAALVDGGFRTLCDINRQNVGVGLTIQCFNIVKKMREVDRLITPERQEFVREVHPELVFAQLAGRDRGLVQRKRTAEGERLRLQLLRRAGARFDPAVERDKLGLSKVARDDVIDAVACLVAAQRIARGKALVLPAGRVEHDARGLRMEIVA